MEVPFWCPILRTILKIFPLKWKPNGMDIHTMTKIRRYYCVHILYSWKSSCDAKEDLVYGVVGYPKYTYFSYGYNNNSIQLLHGLNQIGKNLLKVSYFCFLHSIWFRGLNKFERKFVKSVLRGVYSCIVFVLIGTHSYPPVGISGALGQIFYLRTTPLY